MLLRAGCLALKKEDGDRVFGIHELA
jgi:hypothetical protein